MRAQMGPVLILVALLAAAIGASGGEIASVVITCEVTEIDSIDTNVELVMLVLDSGTAESRLDIARDDTTVTYNITTNAPPESRKITAFISPDTPPYVYLGLQIEPPGPGCPPVPLGLAADPQDPMIGISAVARSGLWMAFELWAHVLAGVVPPSSTTPTLTVVDA